MRLDQSHRGWLTGSVLTVAASTAVYVVYARSAPAGPSGGSWVGLAFGVVGTAMIVFAGVLGARKKVLLARVGPLSAWLKGHLWLGALSLPMILFHGAFAFGGPLTTVLMWLLIVIVVSGILGAILQHAMPSVMTAQVKEERTYEQLDRMRVNLRRDAYELVASVCGAIDGAEGEKADIERLSGEAPREPKKLAPADGADSVRDLYLSYVLPYLGGSADGASLLATGTRASLVFEAVKPQVDPALHETVNDLAAVCHELREQSKQRRLHRWLHGWLLVHIPLSMALLVLMTVHAVMALYF